jgi:hypothetical protein
MTNCRIFASEPGVTPADIAAIPRQELADSLYVVRGRALLINLAKARTPDDWLRIPGIKGAWSKSPLKRGMTTLADADGDGRYELYGEGGEAGPGQCMFWCREADGTVRWKTAIHESGPDNNGVHCADIDGDGKHEVVSVGNYLQILDAATGAVKLKRFIFADFYGKSGADVKGDEVRFDYPYRLARCSDKKQFDIVIANGWSPTGPQPLVRASDGKPDSPKGGVQIIAYRTDGTIAWHYKHEGKGYRGGGHEFRAHDLDGDGLDEIIHSANGGLIVLNHDGTERWRKDGLGEHSDWIPIADINGDGRLDIVVQQGGAKGFIYILDAQTGHEHSRTPDVLQSQIQNLATGRFRPELPGRQIALTTINGHVLRLLDGRSGELLTWPVGAAEHPTLFRWNGLDMYNCAAHDADGDGVDEIFTWSTPKGGQLVRVGREEITTDASKALFVGVAAFKGDGTLRQYWNCYTPTADGIEWGAHQWDMRQFHSPPRRWDVDRNSIEEAYVETEQWIFLTEIADLSKAGARPQR